MKVNIEINTAFITSAISTLSLLLLSIASSNYLSLANQSFATKILLFLTGLTTSASVHLFDKEVNKVSNNVKQFALMNDVQESSIVSNVVVFEPQAFEESVNAVSKVQQGDSVILNVTMLDPDDAQRAVDFIAGGVYGVSGHQERIGESIFLFTPQNVSVFAKLNHTASEFYSSWASSEDGESLIESGAEERLQTKGVKYLKKQSLASVLASGVSDSMILSPKIEVKATVSEDSVENDREEGALRKERKDSA